jgi:hypothetical protein
MCGDTGGNRSKQVYAFEIGWQLFLADFLSQSVKTSGGLAENASSESLLFFGHFSKFDHFLVSFVDKVSKIL